MDVDAFRVSGTSGLPEHVQPTDKRSRKRWFLRGPVDMDWLNRAKRLPKSALATGLALWFTQGVRKSNGPIKVTAAVRRYMSLTPDDARRGIRALAENGLIGVVKGGRGRHPVVEIIVNDVDGLPTASQAIYPPRDPAPTKLAIEWPDESAS